METELKPITHDMISKYKTDEQTIKIIKRYFPRLPYIQCQKIFEKIFNAEPIIFSQLIPSEHITFTRIKKKIEDDTTLKEEYYLCIKAELERYMNEKENGFKELFSEIPQTSSSSDETPIFNINKDAQAHDVFKLICDEQGNLDFKYDFDKPDLEVTTPSSSNFLQRVKFQVSSLPISFGFPTIFAYHCADHDIVNFDEERCHSPEFMYKKVYEVKSNNNKMFCEGKKHKIDSEGRIKHRRCNKYLYPTQKTIFSEMFYYHINFEQDESLKSGDAFSLKMLSPGYYEAVVFLHLTSKTKFSYQIIDVKPIENVSFTMPVKAEGENYMFALQKAVDSFIKQQTNVNIWGLIPLKVCLLIQKFANGLKYPLKMGVNVCGDKSTGKSILLKYYGMALDNKFFLSSNGLSISVPALRGTTEKAMLIDNEVFINRPGYLGTYKTIHIDEIGENEMLVKQLKVFLSETNFSNNMARADGVQHRRTAHVNVSQNINQEHMGMYKGSIKKMYDNMPVMTNIVKPDWDWGWELFQPLEYYNNAYLRQCLKKVRQKLEEEKKFWIDGSDIALHDRFPFFFYLENDGNENLKEVLKENKGNKIIDDLLDLSKHLKFKELDEFMDTLKNKQIIVPVECYQKVDEITKEYNLNLDSRMLEIYYDVLKISIVVNGRETATEEDYNLLRFIIEKTNRKITLTETNDYKINGPVPSIKEILTLDNTSTFGIHSGEDIMKDF